MHLLRLLEIESDLRLRLNEQYLVTTSADTDHTGSETLASETPS